MSNTESITDQRRFSRVPFVHQITLSPQESASQHQPLQPNEQPSEDWQGTVVDISFKGILISGKNPPVSEDSGPLPSVIHFENGIDISADLELAHQHDEFYGFHFSTIDSDSLMHLRKLVSLNLGDDAACQRELMTLFSYHQ